MASPLPHIYIVGGSGFIGRNLTLYLARKGYQVDVVGRSSRPRDLPPSIGYLPWDGSSLPGWLNTSRPFALVNLAGVSVAEKRWTEKQKRKITASRLDPTAYLARALASSGASSGYFLSASAVGYYGDRGNERLSESSQLGKGFLASLCQQWEETSLKAETARIPVALLRFGLVLGKDAESFRRMVLPFRFFLGGPLGSGDQWMPWIHIEDLCETVNHLLRMRHSGPVNVTAPDLISMSYFAKSIGRILKRPSWLRVPHFALNIALGEMAQIVTTSQRVYPDVLMETGYDFRFPSIESALSNLVNPQT